MSRTFGRHWPASQDSPYKTDTFSHYCKLSCNHLLIYHVNCHCGQDLKAAHVSLVPRLPHSGTRTVKLSRCRDMFVFRRSLGMRLVHVGLSMFSLIPGRAQPGNKASSHLMRQKGLVSKILSSFGSFSCCELSQHWIYFVLVETCMHKLDLFSLGLFHTKYIDIVRSLVSYIQHFCEDCLGCTAVLYFVIG